MHLVAVFMNINKHCQELCCVYSETNTISLVIQWGGPAVWMGRTPLIEIIVVLKHNNSSTRIYLQECYCTCGLTRAKNGILNHCD